MTIQRWIICEVLQIIITSNPFSSLFLLTRKTKVSSRQTSAGGLSATSYQTAQRPDIKVSKAAIILQGGSSFSSAVTTLRWFDSAVDEHDHPVQAHSQRCIIWACAFDQCFSFVIAYKMKVSEIWIIYFPGCGCFGGTADLWHRNTRAMWRVVDEPSIKIGSYRWLVTTFVNFCCSWLSPSFTHT